jgi:hypothetical protein
MAILLAIVNWFSSAAFSAIANGVVSVLNKRSDATVAINTANVGAGKDVDLAQINASVAAMHESATLAALRWGWWGSRWLMVAASLPPIIHSGAVYLDSTFKFGWAIARAPGVYEGQELSIIATVVGVLTVQSIGGGIVAAITKKKG